MSSLPSERIHPTALLSAETAIGDGAYIGPYVITEGPVTIGPGCVIRPHSYLIGPLLLGRENDVGPGAVLGERPQHLRDAGDGTRTVIGDHNIFREHVTVHRGTQATGQTVIGHHNFLMAGAHVAHDCVIGDHCVFANGALVGGHCRIGDRVFLSGNSAVHQFTRIGRLALLSGTSATSKDIPPFVMVQGINTSVGVNVVGMRRAGISSARIDAVRRAYHILFHEGLLVPNALTRMEQDLGQVDVVAELIAFLRRPGRGISTARTRLSEAA